MTRLEVVAFRIADTACTAALLVAYAAMWIPMTATDAWARRLQRRGLKVK